MREVNFRVMVRNKATKQTEKSDVLNDIGAARKFENEARKDVNVRTWVVEEPTEEIIKQLPGWKDRH